MSDNSTAIESPAFFDEQLLIQLARIDGIDSFKALKCMSGQTALYLKLVKSFSVEQQGCDQELRQLYFDKDWQTLCRRVHSIKSYTAYVGAFELSQSSGEMEALLNKDNHDETLLKHLATELERIVTAIAALYPEEQAVVSTIKFSIEKLKTSLEALLPLLEHSDFSVEDALPAVVQLCKNTEYAQAIALVAECVDDVEYEKSAELVTNLLTKLTC